MKHKQFNLSPADIKALRAAEDRFGSIEVRASVRDLFALGLYLRLLGRTSEGYKACSIALRTLGLAEARSARILRHLDGNEFSLAFDFQPHVEFLSLIERHNEATAKASK